MNSGIHRGRTALLFLPALLLVVWALCPRGESAFAQIADDDSSSDDSSSDDNVPIPAPLAWEIEGNDNTDDDNFLGTRAGSNFDLVLRTDGLERMRILKGNGKLSGDFSDIDGLVQITTNLRLFDPFNPTLYNGDLIMPLGRWHGFDGQAGGPDRGDLTLNQGDLRLLAELNTTANVALSNGDLLMPFGTWNGTFNTPDQGNLSLTSGNLFAQDGVVGIGFTGDPAQTFELIDPDFYDVLLQRNQVRIGDLGDPVFPPSNKAVLHIEAIGRYPGIGSEGHHAVFIHSHNTPTDASKSPDGIAIQLDSTPGNDFTDEKNNFLTFYDSTGEALGAVESNPARVGEKVGVRFKSGSADFAEYLQKMDPDEVFEAGEIVGIFGGKVTRQTQGADHVLVVTGAPAFLGNAPQENREHLYVKVAFMGQVPVLVRGDVTVGDYIVASGLQDGTAVAIPLAALELVDLPDIVGRAWSDSDAVGNARRDGGASGFADKIVDEARKAVRKGWHPLEGPQPPSGPDVEAGITYITVAVGVRGVNWGGIFNDLLTKSLQVPAPVGVPQAKLDALTKRVAQLEAALQEVIGAKPR